MGKDEQDLDELRAEAKELIEEMPGETALGNRDPEAGGQGDPKTYEGLHADRPAESEG
jgi:hypothetical protein